MSTIRPQKLKDLEYELQLLSGADAIICQIESWDSTKTKDQDKFGNIVNYFKDSVYLHSRNLLNTLTNESPTEIGNIPGGIRSALYSKCKNALERYVMHLSQARDQRGTSNIIDSVHLNEHVHGLAAEVHKCWQDWIDKTIVEVDKERLKNILTAVNESTKNDLSKFLYLTGAQA
jgi:hypothetical protein